MSYLYGDVYSCKTETSKQRAFKLLKKGESIFGRCIERYVQLQIKDKGYNEERIEAKHSYITANEEGLFNKAVIDSDLNLDYEGGNRIYVFLDEVSDLFHMNHQDIAEALKELVMTRVTLRDKVDGSYSVSHLFNETVYFDNEDQYYRLQLNPEFLKVCCEVKMEIIH